MVITATESNNNERVSLEQVMRQIETLRQENEIVRRESEEARQRLEESMRQQEQLQKSNDELRTWMRDRSHFRDTNLPGRVTDEQDENHPLARAIVEEIIPPHFIIPKMIPFTGEGDPEAHLKAFRAQMLISGGSDAVRCKMFVGTLSNTALKWFGKIPHATITSFNVFARLFMERFAVNRPKQLQIADMFDIKQRQEETLKQFLNRFCDVSMGLANPSEDMLIGAFVKGLRANSFSESLIRAPAITLAEIRSRATVYIETEEAMQRKRSEERRPQSEHKSREVRRQIMETSSPYKKASRKFTPYSPHHHSDKRAFKSSCPSFSESKARILQDEGVSRYLRFPMETGRLLGKETSAWCEFHKTHGHNTKDCFPLTGHLASLARRGLVDKYIKGNNTKTKPVEQFSKATAGPHEIPVLGDFNTIVGGFAGGGPTKSARKRYAQNIMTATVLELSTPIPSIIFSTEDTKDIVPHEDDPVVLSVIMMGRNVHRVLID
ncbi:uncharacterized protein LOC114178750 [Vigna unguiculata]|uniref:uncharacterized protein LOC114178750 n=1 Tax=Vigna unguiculata TaxID=3917 RepID=UPI00101607C1|nr:uncharacterized protein LOC114178750 [Vigna unguiculata]